MYFIKLFSQKIYSSHLDVWTLPILLSHLQVQDAKMLILIKRNNFWFVKSLLQWNTLFDIVKLCKIKGNNLFHHIQAMQSLINFSEVPFFKQKWRLKRIYLIGLFWDWNETKKVKHLVLALTQNVLNQC